MCPTCSHSTGPIGDGMDRCPICGTIAMRGDESWSQAVPALVRRCREFEAMLRAHGSPSLLAHWHGTGVYEAIHAKEPARA